MKMPLKGYATAVCGLLALAVAAVSGCAEILGVDFGEKQGDLDAGSGGTGSGGTGGIAPQCTGDEECKQYILEGPSKCDNGQCVAECTTTFECTQKYGLSGSYACIAGGCINLVDDDCPSAKIYPATDSWKEDDPPPIFIGVMDDRSSTDWKADAIEYYWESFRLAQKQLEAKVIGPGPAGDQRKLVFVECDEIPDAVKAATHLVERVRVPLILGPTKYPNQLKVLEQVLAKPSNSAIALTRSALDVVLTHPSNKSGLIWSMSPPGNERAFALAELMKEQEPALRQRLGKIATDPLKVALLTVDDVGYEELNTVIKDKVKVGDTKVSDLPTTDFETVVVKNLNACSAIPDDAGKPLCEYDARAADLLAFRPNVVLVNGPFGLFNLIVKRLEVAWESELCPSEAGAGGTIADRPIYLSAWWDYTTVHMLPFGPCGSTFLPTTIQIAERIREVDFYPQAPESRYSDYLTAFKAGKANFAGPDASMALSYDSTFVMAYALTALLKDDSRKPFTGKDIASAFSTLAQLGGQVVATGNADITKIDSFLEQPETIDLNGIFSRIAFDVTTRAPIFNLAVLCPNANLSSGLPGKPSNQVFNVTQGTLGGTYACN
jgi:hypothetical protein